MDDLTAGLCDTDMKVNIRLLALKPLAVLVKEVLELFSELVQAGKQTYRKNIWGI